MTHELIAIEGVDPTGTTTGGVLGCEFRPGWRRPRLGELPG
ncbi:MAG: hypothetical protein OXG04_07235 [Acidobacteria bacterium]|nr:hypothetical protein [Acidobacteriota bacterium]